MKTQTKCFSVELRRMFPGIENETWNGTVFSKNRALRNFTEAAEFAGLYYDGDDLQKFFSNDSDQVFLIGGLGYDFRLSLEVYFLEEDEKNEFEKQIENYSKEVLPEELNTDPNAEALAELFKAFIRIENKEK
jgi:hypothetical protein